MRAYTLKRVILIIVLSILICLCYVMITGCVYANQDNQNRFSKTYLLSGKGAEDMESVAVSQIDKELSYNLGYTVLNLNYCSCFIIDPFIEFITDCAELAGQEEAFKNACHAVTKELFIKSLQYYDGAVEVTAPEMGDIVVGWRKGDEDSWVFGIASRDSTFITVPEMYSGSTPFTTYIDEKFISEYESRNYIMSYYRPKYQDRPSACGPMEIKGKTVTVSRSKLKKKSQSFSISKALSISGCKDGLTFKKIRGSKNIIINKKNGWVTVRKGLKKKTYKVTVEVSAKGADGTEPLTAKATFKVRVR